MKSDEYMKTYNHAMYHICRDILANHGFYMGDQKKTEKIIDILNKLIRKFDAEMEDHD